MKKPKYFLLAAALFFAAGASAEDGMTLFKAKCAACHKIGTGPLVGPDLKDVQKKRPQPWLLSWIKSSSGLIKSGDTAAVALFERYNKLVMTDFPELSDSQIISILGFISTESEKVVAAAEPPAIAPAGASGGGVLSQLRFSTFEYAILFITLLLVAISFQLLRSIKKLTIQAGDKFTLKDTW